MTCDSGRCGDLMRPIFSLRADVFASSIYYPRLIDHVNTLRASESAGRLQVLPKRIHAQSAEKQQNHNLKNIGLLAVLEAGNSYVLRLLY